jgi:hypothetical protein
MDKNRGRTEALQPGIESGRTDFHPHRSPPDFVEITDLLRPIETGVTNRIRTGTNAFTERDAAVTS